MPLEIRPQKVGRDRLGRRDTGQAQLGDQAILERAPEALDASLGLRRACGDRADAQIDQDPTELRRLLAPANSSSSVQRSCGLRWKMPCRS